MCDGLKRHKYSDGERITGRQGLGLAGGCDYRTRSVGEVSDCDNIVTQTYTCVKTYKLYIKRGWKVFLKESWCKHASGKLKGGRQTGQQLLEAREALNSEGQVQVCEPGSWPVLSPCRLREQGGSRLAGQNQKVRSQCLG